MEMEDDVVVIQFRRVQQNQHWRGMASMQTVRSHSSEDLTRFIRLKNRTGNALKCPVDEPARRAGKSIVLKIVDVGPEKKERVSPPSPAREAGDAGNLGV